MLSTEPAIRELQLEQVPDKRGTYALQDLGTIRLHDAYSGTIDSRGRTWKVAFRLRSASYQAVDPAGAVVGTLKQGWSRSETRSLRWSGHELELRRIPEREGSHALIANGRQLAAFFMVGPMSCNRPVTVALKRNAAIEPELLLFTAFYVLRASIGAGPAIPTVAL